ncbi:MAG: hypothetical protein HY686_01965 [Chloroflexi bacterium]|nr:hypothetical protein [Chloroflexota bacterium]
MSREALKEVIAKAVADYGFRQVVVWSPEDVVAAWALTPTEGELLRTRIIPEMKRLPVPVEPADRERAERRLEALLPGRGP